MNANNFRKKRANELRLLGQVLSKSLSCKNPTILNQPANNIYAPSGKDSWGYNLDGLRFEVEIPQNTLPTNLTKNLEVIINLSIQGECVDDDEHDSIHTLKLDIEISSLTNNGDKHLCAWHFDRHIEGQPEEDASTPPSESHPLFHFQHGGHGMEHLADSLGKVLLPPAPRVAFPPMDALLAVDFILSNFCGEEWQNLRDDGTYKNIVGLSQKRLWKPYFKMILDFWSGGDPAKKGNIQRLWPNLLLPNQ